jgi:hypothetical protein
MRRMAGLIVVVSVVAAVALPSSADVLGKPYLARGNLDFVSIGPPGPPDHVRGAVELKPVKSRGDAVGLGPAPDRGVVSLSAPLRRVAHPPNPCAGLVAAGTMSIAWGDGMSSTGPFTMLITLSRLTVHGNITKGRFKGGRFTVVASVSVTPGPPDDCDASLSGQAMLADA